MWSLFYALGLKPVSMAFAVCLNFQTMPQIVEVLLFVFILFLFTNCRNYVIYFEQNLTMDIKLKYEKSYNL